MAESAAHLTSASPADRPSIFEVLAQESLMLSIRPALKHTLNVLCEIRPERFGWLMRYYDEIYTVLDFILQNYYLNKYCSSFAENFYDLKRVPTEDQHPHLLPRHIYWKSLICLVVLPYIKHKLDRKFEDIRHAINTSQSQTTNLYKTFLGVYPYFHTCWEGAMFSYQLAYMFNKSAWHSPLIQMSGVKLCRNLKPPDSLTEHKIQDWQEAGIKQKVQLMASELCGLTGRALSLGLSTGVFFLQFLDWWYASDSEHTSLTAAAIPDPPSRYTTFTCPPSSICPLCNRTRTNDTALSVSGYVYCYPCIHEYVSTHGVCPVTGYKARTEHLVKIYRPDS